MEEGAGLGRGGCRGGQVKYIVAAVPYLAFALFVSRVLGIRPSWPR